MSYNVHGCINNAGRYAATPILRLIERSQADVVALQEVYEDRLPGRDFLQRLETLPYPHIHYGVTFEHDERGKYGNLLLSKWPLAEIEEIDLGIPHREPRAAIRALVEHPRQTLDVVATHLGLGRAERALQLAKLVAQWELSRAKQPEAIRVLMGDLNEWLPHSAFLQALQGLFSLPQARLTFPSVNPTLGLDRILVRPSRLLRSLAPIDTPASRHASDHLPLLAELSLGRSLQPLV
ncbi:endonuclease/exonuclease/phosphatase family protein [Pelagicoccus sp. NFK12]|uniref:Endonuclease/exonuclease/phosphatase family protein n=1 Tax=Pelagicoccus enzymogenes TaxID=2773457 RepID=A0A927FCN0_9BACT|nr:endonuclease/exonuclease/phosphatase family protein [Pelagicoccus enzymogenes]MBD5781265.1 endonuclease/exonuclease/phosphatase family protein [Pelagicoccus enzymogenes]